MAARRVTSPDGREWEVRIVRVRFPKWRPSDFDPWEEACGEWHGVVLLVPLAVVYWVVVPLLALLVALPFTIVRSLFSSTRWIEAETRWPAPILVRWHDCRPRGNGGRRDRRSVVARLRKSMTEPPGFRDLDA